MTVALAVALLLLVTAASCQNPLTYYVTTYPEKLPGQDKVIVGAEIGQENISIYCNIQARDNNGVLYSVEYEWKLINKTNGVTPIGFDANGDSNVAFLYNTTSDHSNITIDVFTAEMDRTSLVCTATTNVISQTFMIGIYKAPSLIMDSPVEYNIIEGSNWNMNFADSNNDPFPPYLSSSLLTAAGQSALNGNIIVNGTTVLIQNSMRNASGSYTLRVWNAAGSDNTTFILNVQYPPEGTPLDDVVYAHIGSSVNLTSLANLGGNPAPVTYWYDTNNITIINSDGNYLITDQTVLTIKNVTGSNEGNYIFEAINDFGTLTVTIQLIIALPPGKPTNLSVSNVGHETAVLSWMVPNDKGLPQLTHYIVTIIPGDTLITNSTSIYLSNLLPSVSYNVSISGASLSFPNGGLASQVVSFETIEGPPRISTSVATSMNGRITLQWTLRHIGGLDDVSIKSYCTDDPSMTTPGSASGSGLESSSFYYDCDSQCLSPSSVMLDGTVTAGTVYYCTVQAYNSYGSNINQTTVQPTTGIPSTPIVYVMLTDEFVNVIFRSEYPGGNGINFTILLTDNNEQVIHSQEYFYSSYDSANRTAFINNQHTPSSGVFYVIVKAANIYGISEMTRAGPYNITITPTSTPTQIPYLLVIIIASVVGGILIAVVIVTVIICICACCLKRRKKYDVTELRTSRLQTWKKGDVRGIEMSQRKRHLK